MYKFFCDTNCELDHKLVKELGIENIIKMPYTICEKEYYSDLTADSFDPKWFFGLVRGGNVPVTSALNAEEYKRYFEPVFKNGDDIFYVSFGDKFSATFNHMELALKDLSKLYPERKLVRYDTKGISMAAGLVVYYAAKAFLVEGKSVEETLAILDELTPRVNISVIADDLQHLKRGGRLSGAAAAIGGILKIKPIIKLTREGRLESREKATGGINKAIAMVADDVKARIREVDKYPVIVLDADSAAEGDKLAAKIKELLPSADIWRQSVGPVVGTHCGPGTLGVAFVGEDRV